MRFRTPCVAVATAIGFVVASSSAVGAPDNDNSEQRTFICDGSLVTVVGIEQNNAVSFQVVSGADARTFHVTKVVRDGVVRFAVPGWEDRTDVTCTDPKDPGVTGYGFFAPRS